jgi:amidase
MDIVFSDTTQLAAAIRARRVSATEVLEAYLAQIEKHNATLNAIITMDVEQARKRAREADEALVRGELWGPLHGIPFTLKDCHSTVGMRTTAGFLPLADYVPQADSTVTARLKAAGGVLIGKTNVPVLLSDIQTDNPIFGCTRNPWNLDRTPGGSSGGAAAALASGMTAFDIGSDLGGSIRIPAHFCGVFGLKSTENRVPMTGHIPELPGATRSLRVMACIGPMARSVEDLALLYQIIAGPDGHDTEVQPVPVADVPALELKGLRIAFAPTIAGYPVAAEIRAAVEVLAAQLGPHCQAVEAAPLPDLDYDKSKFSEMWAMPMGAFQPEANKPPTTLAQYLEALHRRDRYIIAWERFFEAWDVLLCPAAMVTAFPHCETGSPLGVDGQKVNYWLANAPCLLFNYTGHPAVVLPFKRDRDGLPIGIQVVGKRWDESRLLAIAQSLSAVTGEFQRPPAFI